MPFQNYAAASRKPNMRRFKMFPSDLSLDWIDGAVVGEPEVFEHPTTITGTMNGVNATFVLLDVTSTPAVMKLIWNGLVLMEDVGYTINLGTITMATGYIPESGDTLEALTWW